MLPTIFDVPPRAVRKLLTLHTHTLILAADDMTLLSTAEGLLNVDASVLQRALLCESVEEQADEQRSCKQEIQRMGRMVGSKSEASTSA